jgi:hypothetical protein
MPSLVVQFTDTHVKVALCKRGEVIQHGEKELPSEMSKYGEVLKGALTDIKQKSAIVLLPPEKVYTVQAKARGISHLKEILSSLIPEEIEDLKFFTKILGKTEDKQKEYGVIAVSRTVLKGYMDACKEAGLRVRRVTAPSLILASQVGKGTFVVGDPPSPAHHALTVIRDSWPIDELIFPPDVSNDDVRKEARALLEEYDVKKATTFDDLFGNIAKKDPSHAECGVVHLHSRQSLNLLKKEVKNPYISLAFAVAAGMALGGGLYYSAENTALKILYQYVPRFAIEESRAPSLEGIPQGPFAKDVFCGTEDEPLFTDMDVDDPYCSAIVWAQRTGVVGGYADGTFRPDNTVNRVEFLKIALEAAGVDTSSATEPSGFEDLDSDGWYIDYVRYAKEEGIVEGYEDGTFRPVQDVTVAEALKMGYETLGIETTDVEDGAWYARYLNHALENDVLFEELDPSAGMSRRDTVWVMWKLRT